MNTASSKPKNRLLRRLGKLILALISSGLLLLACLFVYLYITTPEPVDFETRRQAHRPSDSILLDRNGNQLHRLRVNFQVRQGTWIPLEEISPAVPRALINSEDKRFYEHSGIDIFSIGSALWNYMTQANARGASTLSMQLVGLLDDRIAPSGQRNLWQKMQQATAAIVLERHWNKEQILETYLNIVPFRGELVGIGALSEGIFGKYPIGISEREAAIAVAMIRSPNASQSTIARRACTILQQIEASNAQQECNTLTDFIFVRFSQPSQSPSEGIAPHLAYRLLASGANATTQPPVKLQTTLDANIQSIALESLRRHLQALRDQHIEDGGVIVIDNATGEVLAWVGSSGSDISQAAQIDTVTAMRQPGSTLKPFLYGLAIEEKRLTAASLLNDSPLNLNVGGGLYIPQNYDKQFKGWISVRTALASSLNIPTVRTIVMLGPDKFAALLTDLGLPLQETGEYYGYSLALGSAEVTLLSLTNAYRSLANGGQVAPVYWLPTTINTTAQHDEQQSNTLLPLQTIPTPIPSRAALDMSSHQSRLSPEAAWIISSILSDRHARVMTFGLDSELNTRYWSAVKTGTSKDMRDNWAIGYSARYTVGVWVGNADGSPMWGVSGTSGASPVWREVMNALYERDTHLGLQQAWHQPAPPQGLVEQRIHFDPPIEPDRIEWFIEGTQRSTISLAPQFASQNEATLHARILSPATGTIIAVDPDIPPANQRLRLLSSQAQVRWMLGSQLLGEGQQIYWLPLPGRHKITLTDEQGNTLDQINIEVRGASLRPLN